MKSTLDALVGRQDLQAQLVGQLSEPAAAGVLLLGEAGIGKTTAAEAVLARLDPTTSVLRISGSAALRDVPYGAFAACLDGLMPDEVIHPVVVMRRVIQALGGTSLADREPPLLLVDDAHDLDDRSSTLIAQLVGGRKARVLLLARRGPHLTPGLDELVTDGIITTTTMQPLDLDEVGELCSIILGGPVTAALALVVEAVTQGNPMFLRLFLRDGLARNVITEGTGVWHIPRELPAVPVHLVDLVHAELGRLDPETRCALEFLAVGEPMPGDQARQRIGPGVLQRLVVESWLRIREDGSLVLDHPLYGEALRAVIPTARRVALQRDILALDIAAPRAADEVLRRTALSLGAGVPIDDDILLAAATVANRLDDGCFAMRAIRAIRSPDLLGRCLVEMAWVAANRGEYDEALDLVDEALANHATPDAAREGTLLSLQVRARTGGSGKVMQGDIDRWNRLLLVRGDATQSDLLAVTVGRNLVPLLSDDGSFDAAAVRAVASSEAALPVTEIGALLALVAFLIGSGRPGEARPMASRALTLVDAGADTLTYRGYAQGLELMAFIMAGEWDQARSAFTAHYRRDARSIQYFAGWLDLIEGVCALREGRFRTAQMRLNLAAEALRRQDHLHILPWVSGMAAYAALLSGNLRKAGLLVELTASSSSSGSRLARMLGRVYTVSVAAVLAADSRGPAALVELASEAEDAALPLVAATALDQALILGDRAVFGRLAAITEPFDGMEQKLLHRFASAGAVSDPQKLLDVGDAALLAGYKPLATGCYERARELYEKRRNAAAARNAQQRLASASAGLEGPANTRAVRLPAAVNLTRREVAVVALALEGLTNKEIADRHGTSIRTVEGHLYRIFTKFGISRREDLRLFAPDT